MKNSVHGTSTLHSNETLISEYEGSIQCNMEKRHPPSHLTGHKVYKMVKDAHVVLGKRKTTAKNTKEDDMWKKQSIFCDLPYWKDLDVRHSIDLMHVEKNVCEPTQDIA
jgi:hypothetical protein